MFQVHRLKAPKSILIKFIKVQKRKGSELFGSRQIQPQKVE